MLSAAGFDGHIDIFSIMGGSSQAQSQRHADQVTFDPLFLISSKQGTEENLLFTDTF